MKQVSFDMDFTIDGKETVCGLKTMEDDNGPYVLLCATVGDYSREYELRLEGEGDSRSFHFATPDVPEELLKKEGEISYALLQQLDEAED